MMTREFFFAPEVVFMTRICKWHAKTRKCLEYDSRTEVKVSKNDIAIHLESALHEKWYEFAGSRCPVSRDSDCSYYRAPEDLVFSSERFQEFSHTRLSEYSFSFLLSYPSKETTNVQSLILPVCVSEKPATIMHGLSEQCAQGNLGNKGRSRLKRDKRLTKKNSLVLLEVRRQIIRGSERYRESLSNPCFSDVSKSRVWLRMWEETARIWSWRNKDFCCSLLLLLCWAKYWQNKPYVTLFRSFTTKRSQTERYSSNSQSLQVYCNQSIQVSWQTWSLCVSSTTSWQVVGKNARRFVTNSFSTIAIITLTLVSYVAVITNHFLPCHLQFKTLHLLCYDSATVLR